ncbi:MAG: HesA/MoeB/ThiF family protein [Candidatus Woesearchaeota archaeon]
MRTAANAEAFKQEYARIEQESVALYPITELTQVITQGLIGLGVQNIHVYDNDENDIFPVPGFSKKEKKSNAQSFHAILQDYDATNTVNVMRTKPFPELASYFQTKRHIICQDHVHAYQDFGRKESFILTQNGHQTRMRFLEKNSPSAQYLQTMSHQLTPPDLAVQYCMGATVLDEIRKKNIPFQNEYHLQQGHSISFNPYAQLFDGHSCTRLAKDLGNVLIIGAGGIGTYCAASLSRDTRSKITVIDFDKVEESNLNRQILYTRHVGKPKVQALAQELSNITPVQAKLTKSNFGDFSNFDLIFCCTDTVASRKIASELASTYSIPLIEGSCNTTVGMITSYLPNKTPTLSEQRKLHLHKDQPRRQQRTQSCARQVNPSVIIPNMFIGAAMTLLARQRTTTNNPITPEFMFSYTPFEKRKLRYTKWN